MSFGLTIAWIVMSLGISWAGEPEGSATTRPATSAATMLGMTILRLLLSTPLISFRARHGVCERDECQLMALTGAMHGYENGAATDDRLDRRRDLATSR